MQEVLFWRQERKQETEQEGGEGCKTDQRPRARACILAGNNRNVTH